MPPLYPFPPSIPDIKANGNDNLLQATSTEIYGEQMAKLTYLCYIEHLNMALKGRPINIDGEKHTNLRALRLAHRDMGKYMKDLLTHLPFIQKTVQEDAAQGNSLRSMSMLFMADFLSRDPYQEQYPNMDEQFVFKPSFEILDTWSRQLWEISGKGKTRPRRSSPFVGKLRVLCIVLETC